MKVRELHFRITEALALQILLVIKFYLAKSPFGWNGSVLFGDCFYCKKRVLSVLKRKERAICMGKRNGTVPTEHAVIYSVSSLRSLILS